MSFEFFIAKRYLKSKHKLNFITIISLISTVGITIGVAALIVILSVFNGFSGLVTNMLVSFDPHLKISSAQVINYPDKKISEVISEEKEVKSFSPFVEGKVIAIRDDNHRIVNLSGVEFPSAATDWGVQSKVVYGEFDLREDEFIPGIVVGITFATRVQSLLGDTLTLASFYNVAKSAATYNLPITQNFIVTGIFKTGNKDYDDNYLYTNLASAQRALGVKRQIHGYEIRLSNIEESNSVKSDLQEKLGENFTISTWFDLHEDLYTVMQIERWAAYIILSLIIAVASFNLLGSLTMSVIEKKKDIGLLRSLGAKQKSMLRIFMFEGALIGMIGSFLGAALGYLVCWLQQNYKLYPLDPNKYVIDALPIAIRVSDFFWVIGAALVLSFLASLYPAKRAAKLLIIDALKWE